jgi:hypothetical protein
MLRYLALLDGSALAEELRSHHGYTASINEPGGNHQNEAALCGLPLLYRDSSCLPEYCNGFGVSFSGASDFESAPERYMMEYDRLVAVMPQYPWTANRMAREWIALFKRLLNDRPAVVSNRRLWRNPMSMLANQPPM